MMVYTVLVGTLQIRVTAMTAVEAVEKAKEKLGNYKTMILEIKRMGTI